LKAKSSTDRINKKKKKLSPILQNEIGELEFRDGLCVSFYDASRLIVTSLFVVNPVKASSSGISLD